MTVGAVQIQNLLYLAGAVAVATLWISVLYLLRHRKPRSMEAGIESFSRELRALAPDRRPPNVQEYGGRPSGARARGTGGPAGTDPPSAQSPAERRTPIRDEE